MPLLAQIVPPGWPDHDAIRAQLDRILASEPFARSARISRFLKFAVEQTLKGNANSLKEYTLGVEVFDKSPSFDPRTDTIVRVEVRRLRTALFAYYASTGQNDPILIELPKGAYVARFAPRSLPSSPTVASPARLERGPTLAVLPFVDMSEKQDQEYFCDGLTEQLIHAFTGVDGLRVVARTSSFQFKGKAEDVRRIGELLNVGVVMEGSIQRAGDSLRITAQLIDTTDGFHILSEVYDCQYTDIFRIQDEIASAVLERMRLKPGAKIPGLQMPTLEAYNLHLLGQHFFNKWTPEGVQRAIDFYTQAIAADPNYSLAYLGLANCFGLLGYMGTMPLQVAAERHSTLTEKALELAGPLAEGYISRAIGKAHFEWNWPAAEQEFRRGISLSPKSAHSRFMFGVVLAQLGRFPESRSELETAVVLDPLSTRAITTIGKVLALEGNYRTAEEQLWRAIEIDPGFQLAYQTLGLLYTQMGDSKRAISIFEKALALAQGAPEAMADLARANLIAGRQQEATEVRRQLKTAASVPSYDLAIVHAAAGELDDAFSCLQAAVAQHDMRLTWMKVDPRFQPLQSDPRFAGTLQDLGFNRARDSPLVTSISSVPTANSTT